MNAIAGSGGPVTVRIERPEQQTLVLVVDSELVIGRDCEGLLLADHQVSRRHLRLRVVGGLVEVADLNSTNGSFLEGVPLHQPQLIERTSRVLLGETVVTIELAERASASFGRATTVRVVDDLRATSIEMVADVVSDHGLDLDSSSLDSDTITILFSDIESSTERAVEMGDILWFALLDEHNHIIRAELARFGGREVKSIGDGFMLVFPSVRRALRFAIAVQRLVEAPAGPDLRIRMGLHTGEAITDAGGDLFGRHVNLAARVANLAVGGQILASVVVREIAEGRNDATFGDPARVELKGFADQQTVYEVRWSERADGTD